jgi:hypothetical protein
MAEINKPPYRSHAMTTRATGASAPTRKTRTVSFHSANYRGQNLFAVRPGVPAENAMETASCYLASALDACNVVAEDPDLQHKAGLLFAAVYLVEMAKAAVDASCQSFILEDSQNG